MSKFSEFSQKTCIRVSRENHGSNNRQHDVRPKVLGYYEKPIETCMTHKP